MEQLMSEEMDLNDHHAATLDCTHCRQRVVVRLNRDATGNLTIKCPKCGHEHYRYCKDGEITEDRWRSSAGFVPTYLYSTTATNDTATYTSYASAFAADLWRDTGTASSW